MESFKFFGGRYNRPEEIMSGPVQAFRAQSSATGRPVFIHMVSIDQSPQEQSALQNLLTKALVKSADVKRLVLDLGEERGYWYVVTESEPQCALLREWLQTELDNLAGIAHQSTPAAVQDLDRTMTKPAAIPLTPKAPLSSEPGEFTRFIQARTPATSSSSVPRIIPQHLPTPTVSPISAPIGNTAPPQPPSLSQFPRESTLPTHETFAVDVAPAAAPKAPPSRPAPGEFTSFFSGKGIEHRSDLPAGSASMASSYPPPNPPPPEANLSDHQGKAEPGEFTRFFIPGMPQPAPKPPATSFNPEKSQNSPYVQRPNSPVPPAGEFTSLFSRPPGTSAPTGQTVRPLESSAPVRSDPLGFSKETSGQLPDSSDNLFNQHIEVGSPIPSSKPKQGEFTAIFGTKGAEAPQMPPPAVVAQPNQKPLLDEAAKNNDPYRATQQLPAMNFGSEASNNQGDSTGSPSEFTMIIQGGNAKPQPGATGTGALPPSAAAKSSASSVPLNFPAPSIGKPPIPKPNLAVLGSATNFSASASPAGASANSPLGSAHMSAPPVPHPQIKIPQPNIQVPPAALKPKAGANTKIIVLIVSLALIALIVIVLFLLKSK